MNAISTYLDELITVLRAAADLHSHAKSSADFRTQLAARLNVHRPDLAARIRGMDDWHVEVLADFIAEAVVVAAALDYAPAIRVGADDTRIG